MNLQVPTLSYFPNIIHPIDQQPPLSFVVFKITHKEKGPVNPPPSSANKIPLKKESASTSIDRGDLGDLGELLSWKNIFFFDYPRSGFQESNTHDILIQSMWNIGLTPKPHRV